MDAAEIELLCGRHPWPADDHRGRIRAGLRPDDADRYLRRRPRGAVRDTRQRVCLYLTPDGHAAYRDHVDALRAIVNLPG